MLDFKSNEKKMKIRFPRECTIYQAERIKAELFEKASLFPQKVRINLSAIEEFDTAGIQILISLKKSIEYDGKEVKFQKPSEKVIEFLNYYGLSESLLGEKFSL